MRVAFASMALKTGSSSLGEELTASSTSEVAVSALARLTKFAGHLIKFVPQACRDACPIGALCALGLVVRRPFLDRRPLLPRVAGCRPYGESHDDLLS